MKTLIILLIICCACSCERDMSPLKPLSQGPPPATITLAVVPEVDEAVIVAKVAGTPQTGWLEIMRGDSLIFSDSLVVPAEHTLLDSGLYPATDYQYSAAVISNGKGLAMVEKEITTMDTTQFFQIAETITFPSYGLSQSYFRKIDIDEGEAWAVGKIFADDTLPQEAYNAAYYNGSEWALRKIYYSDTVYHQGDTIVHRWANKLNVVYALDKDDILFGGNGLYHYNGANFSHLSIPQGEGVVMEIFGIYGYSLQDFYLTGKDGHIVQYFNGTWTRSKTGELPLLSISGNDNNFMVAVGADPSMQRGIVLANNQGNNWQILIQGWPNVDPGELLKTKLQGSTEGVFVSDNGNIYTVGNYMYSRKNGIWHFFKTMPDNSVATQRYVNRGYLHDITGQQQELLVCGSRSTIWHFNGIRGRMLLNPASNVSYYAVAMESDIAFAVGRQGSQAVITKLMR